MEQYLNPRFYKLTMEFSRRDGYEEGELPNHDLWMHHFPNAERYRTHESDDFFMHFVRPQILDFPEGIEFMGIWEFLQVNDPALTRVTDYPSVRESWPIMSKRMYNTLLSVGSFPHQVIPITVVSDLKDSDETTDDFIAVQLTKHLENVLDLENSVYEDTEYLGRVFELMALKEPKEGFPPLFRIKEKPTRLYVSSKAKIALENAGLKDIDFSTYELASV